jgi:fatty-acid desaturase
MPVIRQHGVEAIRNSRDQRFQKSHSGLHVGTFNQRHEGELRGAVDGHEEIKLALGGAHLSKIDVEVADRVALKLLSSRASAGCQRWKAAASHQSTDKEGDPHSPRDGGLWVHTGWILTGQQCGRASSLCSRPSQRQIPRMDQPLALGAYYSARRRLSFCLWMAVSIVGHLLPYGDWTALDLVVNSATHMWGRQRFHTGDTSRNSFWVALLTFGEGWHNNHHAHPQSSRHGLAWYEIDLNWYGISALRMLGLAWDVKAQDLLVRAEQ